MGSQLGLYFLNLVVKSQPLSLGLVCEVWDSRARVFLRTLDMILPAAEARGHHGWRRWCPQGCEREKGPGSFAE